MISAIKWGRYRNKTNTQRQREAVGEEKGRGSTVLKGKVVLASGASPHWPALQGYS